MSKAFLHAYTAITAKKYPQLTISSITPGFVATGLTAAFPGEKITPEQATVSIRATLFNDLTGSGYFYGSDGVRSPLIIRRNPGEPAYDGK